MPEPSLPCTVTVVRAAATVITCSGKASHLGPWRSQRRKGRTDGRRVHVSQRPAAGPTSPQASSFCSWHQLSLAQAVSASPDTPHSLLGTVARTKSLSSTYLPRGLPLGQKELGGKIPRKGNWCVLPSHFKLERSQGCLKSSRWALVLGEACRL